MNEIKDLSKWIYYTGLFLSDFEKNKENSEIHSLIFNNFLYENGFQKFNSFHLWNQGTMLMLLFGLFVLPKEFWLRFISDDDHNQINEADKLIFEKFAFNSRKNFLNYDNGIDQNKLDKETFLKRLRNSIAHNRIEIVKSEESVIKFSNIDNTGKINFSVRITPINLTEFLNEIGKFFIDNI